MAFSLERLRQLDTLPLDVYANQMQGLFQTIKNASKEEVLDIQSLINLYSMYGSQRNSNIRLNEALVDRKLTLMRIQREEDRCKKSWWPFKKITNEKSKDSYIKREQQKKGLDKTSQVDNQMVNKQDKTQKLQGVQMMEHNMLGKDSYKDAEEEQREELTQETFQEEEMRLLTWQETKLKRQ